MVTDSPSLSRAGGTPRDRAAAGGVGLWARDGGEMLRGWVGVAGQGRGPMAYTTGYRGDKVILWGVWGGGWALLGRGGL